MAKIKCNVESCANNVKKHCSLEEITVTCDDNGEFARRAAQTKCKNFLRE
ncbi:DUF1540 domain-containing protein [Halanaerobacter jeridensis]|uniref:DUF1540 domain-containing protein n=1 Tax=Halanaerobacter jeridensis TaxID=706427 RepID=A0A938XVS0_9FIRM|nr:DUF1540 domain-containing protein [Halanaerobacter jeridensis]MBM7556502.1 hypothetical protein [Halanaerobacter jeridensis]